MNVHRTRIAGLGYANPIPGMWRVVDIHEGVTHPPRFVGEQYASKAELLVDFDRYARTWGYGVSGDGEMKDYLVVVNEDPDGYCIRNVHIQASGLPEVKKQISALDPILRIEAIYEKVA